MAPGDFYCRRMDSWTDLFGSLRTGGNRFLNGVETCIPGRRLVTRYHAVSRKVHRPELRTAGSRTIRWGTLGIQLMLFDLDAE